MEEKKRHPIRTIFKLIFYFLFIFIISSIVFRSCRISDIPLNEKILVNDKFIEAYENNSNEFKIIQYGMQDAYTQVGEGRLLTFDKFYHIPLANQAQLSLKYNTDIINENYEDMPLKVYLTDENDIVYDEYFFEYQENYQYAFLRICFDNIEISEGKEYTVHVYKKSVEGLDENIAEYQIYNGGKFSKEIEFDNSIVLNAR